MRVRTQTASASSGCAARLCGGLTALIFGSFWLLFFGAIWRDVYRARSWQPTPCRILFAEVARDPVPQRRPPLQFFVRYEYDHAGSAHLSERYSFLMERTAILYSRSDLRKAASRYPVEKRAICFVNPQNSDEAVLERGYPASFLWASMAAGLPVVWGVWLTLTGGQFRPFGRRAN